MNNITIAKELTTSSSGVVYTVKGIIRSTTIVKIQNTLMYSTYSVSTLLPMWSVKMKIKTINWY